MLYQAYHLLQKTMKPLNLYSKAVQKVADTEFLGLNRTHICRFIKAKGELLERLTQQYEDPGFSLDKTIIDGQEVNVKEKVITSKPFCNLVHFEREGKYNDPAVLMIAPMAGHYASLMSYTVKEFLPDHEVYITDWKSARDVPLHEGDFGYEDFLEYVMDFMRAIGPKNHLLAACQPCPWALTAASLMAMENDPAQPISLTLMAGPVDARINTPGYLEKALTIAPKINETIVNKLILDKIPAAYPGRGRKVYAGFRQLSMFLLLNLTTHLRKHLEFYRNVVRDNKEEADVHRDFYDNYMAVMDGTATFFHDTTKRIFFECHLPEGKMEYRGKRVDPCAIKNTALFTVEGENDEFCPPGQTKVAHDLCPNIPKYKRGHHVQEGVGHYGVFNGSKFSQHVAPRIKEFMRAAETGKTIPNELSEQSCSPGDF